jgi:hypothetical protein
MSSMISLTKKQRRALEDFAVFKISLEQLRAALGDAMEVNFSPHERRVLFHYDNREPVVHIELRHIRDVMDRHARGEITTEQLSDWAAMLLANPSYSWGGPDEDEIADWLNDISLLALKPNAQAE